MDEFILTNISDIFILVVTNFDVKIILSRKSHTYDDLKNPYFPYYFKFKQCCLTCLLDITIFKMRNEFLGYSYHNHVLIRILISCAKYKLKAVYYFLLSLD